MFREGHYLEVIKASEYCAATAIVTIQEKTVEIKKKLVSTNKWLDLEDWAALYEILEKALIRNSEVGCSEQKFEPIEKKKTTRHLDVTYTFEPSEDPNDRTSLPTIRVKVSAAQKKIETKTMEVTISTKNCSEHKEGLPSRTNDYLTNINSSRTSMDSNDRTSEQQSQTLKSMDQPSTIEEYVPKATKEQAEYKEYIPKASKEQTGYKEYVPSRKSSLQKMQRQTDANEYTPTVLHDKVIPDIHYVPNSIPAAEGACAYETYEPSSTCIAPTNFSEEYVPNSMGASKKVEEYQPDFTSKLMKFDNSYVPSSSRVIRELKRSSRKLSKSKKARRNRDERPKDSVSSRKSCTLVASGAKREM
ncbi:uncharacterized protein LOC107262942 [Cephus cinctus]|uniref:Uncharacterized protein LOC107262942 n=1 Tax=Cephus cinctus TaxID=211228 RepID=A0AAJ7FCK6_CEPCN|nr:uncharacterized protein LOC107262942 [Cephus cinctus]XP_015585140.1 uncharacterized protein LOC107262942 [Cephus cinctus]XP_015585141.1 uncharacterized protein LOC107262942 [Cephus cinctus]XP_015585142.1 uncharacterized protein LOC107262942 [Cephus cinctus]